MTMLQENPAMPFEVIDVQATPNPNALKFILSAEIAPQTLSFFNAGQAESHPIARRLFAINGVVSVLLLGDFVTVNKRPDARWPAIRRNVEAVLRSA
jgi:hypothetical protein